MNDAVAEGNVSIGNGQGPKKSRILGAKIVDSHRGGFVRAMFMWRKNYNNGDEKGEYTENKNNGRPLPPFCNFFPF
jgi:hypothetical protein